MNPVFLSFSNLINPCFYQSLFKFKWFLIFFVLCGVISSIFQIMALYEGLISIILNQDRYSLCLMLWIGSDFFLRAQGLFGAYLGPSFTLDLKCRLWRLMMNHIALKSDDFDSLSISKYIQRSYQALQLMLSNLLPLCVTLMLLILGVAYFDIKVMMMIFGWLLGSVLIIYQSLYRGSLFRVQHDRLSHQIIALEYSLHHKGFYFKTAQMKRALNRIRYGWHSQYQTAIDSNLSIEGLGLIKMMWLLLCVGLSWPYFNQLSHPIDYGVMMLWFQVTRYVDLLSHYSFELLEHFKVLKESSQHGLLSIPVLQSFQYDNTLKGLALIDVNVVKSDRYILNQISFRCFNGSHLAIQGASGVGKSTLMKVLIGGQSIEGEYRVGCLVGQQLIDLKRDILFLPQDLCLKGESLLSIIRYFAGQTVTLSEINSMLNEIGLKSLIESTQYGWASRVGIDVDLSRGQIQSLIMVGVCVSKQPIALLDEPLVSVDEVLLERIWNVFLKKWTHRTWILISHHPKLYHSADEVIRLVEGRIE